MRQRAEYIPTIGNNVAKAGAEAILREWVEVMPVDTSEAVSNTRVGLGSPPAGTIGPFFPGRHGSTRGPSSERALQEGLEAISRKRPGQDIFVSNTAGHIKKLDAGSSVQFAGGFVPRALIVFKVAVEEARKKLWGKI
jgi:hypothetical protein